MNLEGTSIELYPHQIESIKNMELLESTNRIIKNNVLWKTKIGINADATGYGKTLSMIGLIVRNKMEWDVSEKHLSKCTTNLCGELISHTMIHKSDRLSPTLIFVGPSVLRQWNDELKKTSLSVCLLNAHVDANKIDVEEYDVILTTTAFILELTRRYTGYTWKRFIFDEPSNIPLPFGVHIDAGFIWLITATPEMIRHFCSKRKNILMKQISYHMHQLIPIISVKNTEEAIQKSFCMPKTNFIYHVCHNDMYKIVNNLVDEKVQHLIEAGNMAEAIILLGGQSTSNLIEAIQINNKNQLSQIEAKINYYTAINNAERIAESILKRDECVNKMNILKARIKDILKDKCCVCFDDFKAPVVDPNCNNAFCAECIYNWVKAKKTCPLCRHSLELSNLIVLKTEEKKEEEIKVERLPTKEEKILELISVSKPNSKFIIYSDEKTSFEIIKRFLILNNIDYFELKGNTNVRYKKVQKYKTGNTPYVAFLNSIKDCSGVNLQETTDIIFYHSVNDNLRTQIIGRANRIGRKIELNVHELLLE